MRSADEPNTAAIVVCLCGSSRFKRTFLEAQLEESLAGRVVLSLPVFTAVDGCELGDDELATLMDLQSRKIGMADEVLVIDPGGYVGQATRDEIDFARKLRKRIRFWSKEHLAVPERRLKPMDVLLDVAEVHQAQGFSIELAPTTAIGAELKQLVCALIDEEAKELDAAVNADDLVEIADALADLLWVVTVGALSFGIPLGEVFAEVVRSNRSKVDPGGRVERDASGKVRKGSHFSPPELEPILIRRPR
jgi:phosphoribosyl-ATP pyrophosphohydrolase